MKQRSFREKLRRIRSLSFSHFGFGGGATLAPAADEREVLVRLLAQLGDRRILYHHSCRVVHQDMIASLSEMRANLTSAIEQIPKSAAVSFLSQMRQACHDFQSVVEAYYRDAPAEPLQADFHLGLAGLRRTFGSCAVQLCCLYDIDVPGDLTRLLPDTATRPEV